MRVLTCAYVCFTYAVVTILFLFLSRVNRAILREKGICVNYITFKNGYGRNCTDLGERVSQE